ncbi:TIGR00266 family protein [Desulfonema magnum]|uniref:Mitochondrial biogenesis AIM24 domain-containing protein n=1 Tax=Desulfonema magnum TaxID=45655 RepID=A0A975BV12_9BACT|nr:TIGR00266 family protein [Desulfonema magnum]QTA91734.1 Mitochondrial biogenesis AIM24 domain-containing protein [Desulfonema magnum]
MADMFADYKKDSAGKKEKQADIPNTRPEPGLTSDRNFEYLHRGAFTMLKVNLRAGERIKAESDAMVAMSANVSVEGKLEGGVLGGLGRMLSGEKFFFQTLKAQGGPGEVYLSPAIPGDIMDIEMDGNTSYILQKDGFFAGSEDLTISTSMQNLAKGLFSGEGFFIIKASGRGTLFVSSYGAIHPLDLSAGEEIVVDNCHLVAWPETMDYTIEKASAGWISSFTSGEGLVCRFRGPGRVLIQTRNPRGFGSWVRQFMPAR